MSLSKRDQLRNWVHQQHSGVGQVRKYNGEPYINHCVEVGNLADFYIGAEFPLIWEAGVCHDLFEDTNITATSLFLVLTEKFGYTVPQAEFIVQKTSELTDIYTKESFPLYNRRDRKALELKRWMTISPEAVTLKHCDFISNAPSIAENDPKFAKTFLREKKVFLHTCEGASLKAARDAVTVWAVCSRQSSK